MNERNLTESTGLIPPLMISRKDDELVGVANRSDPMGVLAVWSARKAGVAKSPVARQASRSVPQRPRDRKVNFGAGSHDALPAGRLQSQGIAPPAAVDALGLEGDAPELRADEVDLLARCGTVVQHLVVSHERPGCGALDGPEWTRLLIRCS